MRRYIELDHLLWSIVVRTKRQQKKDKDQKESLMLWCWGSFALLQCFVNIVMIRFVSYPKDVAFFANMISTGFFIRCIKCFLDALASLELVMRVTGSQIFREILSSGHKVNRTTGQKNNRILGLQPYNLATLQLYNFTTIKP